MPARPGAATRATCEIPALRRYSVYPARYDAGGAATLLAVSAGGACRPAGGSAAGPRGEAGTGSVGNPRGAAPPGIPIGGATTIGRAIGATGSCGTAMPMPGSASTTPGCDGVCSGSRCGGSCIGGACGRPAGGRMGGPAPPPSPGGCGSGGQGQQSSGSSSPGGSSQGGSLGGVSTPPPSSPSTGSPSVSLFVVLGLRRLMGHASAAESAFTRLTTVWLVAARSGARRRVVSAARPHRRRRSPVLPGFGPGAISVVGRDRAGRRGRIRRSIAGTDDQPPVSHEEAGRGDAHTRTHFCTTHHTHRRCGFAVKRLSHRYVGRFALDRIGIPSGQGHG